MDCPKILRTSLLHGGRTGCALPKCPNPRAPPGGQSYVGAGASAALPSPAERSRAIGRRDRGSVTGRRPGGGAAAVSTQGLHACSIVL